MSDIHVTAQLRMTRFGTVWSRLLVSMTVLVGATNCSDSVDVTLRADAVGPAKPTDVKYSLDGRDKTRTGVQPGEKIELGSVDVGTTVVFEVANSNDAGHVSANILVDNCFRATATCSEPGCVATARYTAAVKQCSN
jgi:hypothetical protein